MTDVAMVDLMETVLTSPYANTLVRQFVMTALAKLSVRFAETGSQSGAEQQRRINQIIANYSTNLELEIQQRSVEFGTLLNMGDVKMGVLERMPPPEIKATIMGTVSERRKVGTTRADKDTVVDLIGDDMSAPSGPSNGAPQQSLQSTQDLLADIFGSSDATPVTSPSAPAPAKSHAQDIMSLFDSSPATSSPAPTPAPAAAAGGSLFDLASTPSPPPTTRSPPPAPAAARPPQAPQLQSYTAYEKNGLKITLTPKVSAQPGVVQILARFTSASPVEGVNFQVAVPKVSCTKASRLTLRPSNCRCRPCRTRTSSPGRPKRSSCASLRRQVHRFDSDSASRTRRTDSRCRTSSTFRASRPTSRAGGSSCCEASAERV